VEEYLTVNQLSERIKLKKQTIYNHISKKTFVLNYHYVKPSPKKVLFLWSKIHEWLHGSVSEHSEGPQVENLAKPSPDIENAIRRFISI